MKERTGATAERLALAAKVAELRRAGLVWRQIAVRLGISRSYASDLWHDPYGSAARARKDSYSQPCPECGKPMNGGEGPANPSSLCAECAVAAYHANRYWTRARLIESLLAFQRKTGRQPTATDKLGRSPSQRQRLSPERRAEVEAAPELPHIFYFQREFGSWSAALEAAGMAPNPTGQPAHRGRRTVSPARLETLALISERPRTIGELASIRGIHRTGQGDLVRSLLADNQIVKVGGLLYPADQAPEPSPNGKERRPMAREFIVLHKNGKGWNEVETVEAVTSDLAIEKAVAKTNEAGTYVAVPVAQFVERPVGEVTRLAVITE